MTIYDYYEMLDLRSDAGEDELKRAYRIKAKEYHPDHNASPEAQENFIRIHNAYEVLQRFLSTKKFFIGLEEAYRQRARYYAQIRYEEYVQECEAYHTSPYRWLFRMLYYGLYYLYIFCAMIFAFVPVWAGLSGGLLYFVICLPLYLLAYLTVVMARGWKKEIEPLFN